MRPAMSATIGVVCLSAGLAGYLLAPLPLWQRIPLLAAAIVLIKPGLYTDAIGIGILVAVVALNLLLKSRTADDTA